MRLPETLLPGRPYPLGATWDGLGVNFAVFSAHAERIDLCMFEPSGRHEIARYTLPEYTDEIWHGYLPDAPAGLLYGYRAFGPYDPQRGHRFNPNKLLLDPYARALSGQLRWSDALYGYRVNSPRGDLSFDRRDSAPAMPKGVVTDDSFNWGDDRPPDIPWSRHRHLRGACPRPDHAAPGRAEARTRHLRGPRRSRGHRPPAAPRRHRDRTAAGPRLRAGPRPAAARAAQLLGLQHARPSSPRNPPTCRTARPTSCASPSAACTPPASR